MSTETQEVKNCLHCKEELPISFFATYKKTNGEIAHLNKCKSCKVEENKKYRAPAKEKEKNKDIKQCNICQKEKDIDEFSKYVVKNKTYLRPYCKGCANEKYNKPRRAKVDAACTPKIVFIDYPEGTIDVLEFAIKRQRSLYAFALKMSRSVSDAWDILQNTYIYLLRNKARHRFYEERKLLSFLFIAITQQVGKLRYITKYECVDFDSKEKRQELNLPCYNSWADTVDFHDLIDSMQERERLIFRSLYSGYDIAETAQKLDIGISVVKNCIALNRSKFIELSKNQ
jgi:DNA-directed RNA polymerase specialized sigma24 family protein